MGPSVAVEPARLEERAPAFRLIFQHLTANEREQRVATALHLVERGELDPAGLLVARQGGVVGAMLCQVLPGASGLVWPPQTVLAAGQREWEDLLVRRAVEWMRRQGAKLGQALMSLREAPLAAPLVRNGFAHITRLSYLRRLLSPSDRLLPVARRLTCQSYDCCDQALFHRTLLRTYEDTLDCPEISDVRDLDEVIAGHRAQGKHDPALWWLARDGDRPIGVLLLTEMPEWEAWDVSYVGVVPEARRCGLGRELMIHALTEAQAAGVSQMTLSVDDRNRPAWHLYRSLGFEPYDQREVYLAVWEKGNLRITPSDTHPEGREGQSPVCS
jgi:ribosomal protein S18 acetylase RimI-like enzyme